jgi:ABC-type glycerol-3-phosphate transport system permease component
VAAPVTEPTPSTPALPEAIGRTDRKRHRPLAVRLAKHLVLLAFVVLCLFPILLIVSTAFKSAEDVTVDPFGLFTSFSVENFVDAWTEGQFGSYLWNSALLSVPTTICTVLLSTAAGYAFARCPFTGRQVVFYLIVVGLLVPPFTTMIPLYYQLRQMALLDTLWGVQLVLVSGTLAFGTFFMRSFFQELPTELEQAARVDGCSEWSVFTRVMLPLVRAGMAALGVFTFLENWNNFLVPLLYLPSGEYRPLTTGLFVFASGRTTDVGPLAAGALITVLPVMAVFVVAQRQVVRGFIAGAVKG